MKKPLLLLVVLGGLINQVPTLLYAQGAKYLIITHDDFYDAILPLAEWKHKKGVEIKVVKLSETGGNASQIKNYIQNAYNTWNPRPEYVLLVGDVEFLPSYYSSVSGIYTDNYYACLAGGDILADVGIGRFSVDNIFECSTMVAKTLGYERTPWMQQDEWFKRATLLIRDDHDSGDTLWYYPDIWFTRDFMVQHGYIDIDTLFEKDGADAGDIEYSVTQGSGFVGYRGCGGNNWYQPFDANPNNTANGWKLPIIFSGTCNTGHFEEEGYICESWIRAGTPTEPKGAVAFIGTNTANYSPKRSVMWRGFWRAIFVDSIFTLGDALVKAKQYFYDQFGDAQGREYKGWHLLGDPELNLWTDIPESLNVVHPYAVYLGNSSFAVTVKSDNFPVESALVCLFKRNEIYEYGNTDANGNITFSITPLSMDTMWVTVTGHNYLPYEGYARVVSQGPYVALLRYIVVDTAGTGDGIPNPNEQIWLPTWVKNYGNDTAEAVTGILSTTDPYITLIDSVEYFGNIAPSDSMSTSTSCAFLVASNCPGNHIIQFTLTCSDTIGNNWHSSFTIPVMAPIISMWDRIVDDAGQLNPNGFIDPGETVRLIISLTNNGDAPGVDISATLLCADTCITITDSSALYGNIPVNSVVNNASDPYIIVCDSSTPLYHAIPFSLHIASEWYDTVINFSLKAGIGGNYLVWDPDINHTSGPILDSILSEVGYSGEYTIELNNLLPYLSEYSVIFICLGVAYNHYTLYTPQNASLIDSLCRYLENGGRIYMEGGNTWYGYSNVYLHPYFHVIQDNDGYEDTDTILGQYNSFTSGMRFKYSGENRSMDRIIPDSGAWSIFANYKPSYVNGVAYASGCNKYKTLIASYEFGGLVDGVTTKAELIDSIMKWFLSDASHDVALWKIESPKQFFVILDSSITPRVSVKNIGAYEESLDVICTIDSTSYCIYSDTVPIILSPDRLINVEFTSWMSSSPGNTYTIVFNAELASDGELQNNILSKEIVGFDLNPCINSNYTFIQPVMDGYIDTTYEWLDANRVDISNIFGRRTHADSIPQPPGSVYLYVMNSDTCVYFGIDVRIDQTLDDMHYFFFGFDDNNNDSFPSDSADSTEGVICFQYHPQGADWVYYFICDSLYHEIDIELPYGVSTTSGNLQYEWALPIGELPQYLNISGDTVGLGIKVGHYGVYSNNISYGRWPYLAYEPVLNAWEMGDLVLASQGTETIDKLPKVFSISQNRPNPVIGKSTILYQLPVKSLISLKIYNIAGRLIKILIDKIEEPGYKKITWDGKDNTGRNVASGIYLYRFEANSLIGNRHFTNTKKIIFLTR